MLPNIVTGTITENIQKECDAHAIDVVNVSSENLNPFPREEREAVDKAEMDKYVCGFGKNWEGNAAKTFN